MKRILYLIYTMRILTLMLLFFLSVSKGAAAPKSPQDTIYVKCFQEMETDKFYYVSKNSARLTINFTFKVDWAIHHAKKNAIMFSFNSASLNNTTLGWFVKKINAVDIKSYQSVYTLAEFTKKLKDSDFSVAIANQKVQVMLLYGSKRARKFELYPVKIGTDLSTEG